MIHYAIGDKAGDHWRLRQEEGRALAVAASNVARHYDIGATQKMQDWGNLMICLFGVYIPRIGTTIEMKRNPPPRVQVAA